MQNGKDKPISREARARQELRTTMLEENVDEKVMYIVYMSIDQAIGRAPYKIYIGCLVYGNRGVLYIYVQD